MLISFGKIFPLIYSSKIDINKRILPINERNRQVKDYIISHFCQHPPYLSHALKYSAASGLKAIHVPENVAKTLYILAKIKKPRRILEIGTLGGYSTLWLAKSLEEGGKLISIECEEKHIKVAQENIAFAGMEDRIEVRKGMANEVLEEMLEGGEEPFDVIFIDADKDNYPEYLEPCLKLTKKGSILLSDNLIPKRGDLGIPDTSDNEALGIYTFNQLLAHHPQLETILLTTIVGESGRLDALGVSIVR